MTSDQWDDGVGNHFFIRESLAVNPRRHQRVNQAAIWTIALLLHSRGHVALQIFETLDDLCHTIRMVLKITEHFSQIDDPGMELFMIFDGHTKQLCRND